MISVVDRPSREHIVREIKRLAEDNGGVPVGRERFFALTGISDGKWRGRYWTRWSDAIREAGYEPGVWQSQVYSDEELTEMLALVTRDLGRYPTTDDLKMRRQAHPELPTNGVFTKRFGNKAEIVRRVLDFADYHSEFADVAAICAPMVGRAPADSPGVGRAPESVVTGAVYLVRMGEFYKIGKSNDPSRRIYELGLRLPEKHEVEHVVETDDPAGIEAYWHRRFAGQRANGEWFRLAAADVAAFRRRAYM